MKKSIESISVIELARSYSTFKKIANNHEIYISNARNNSVGRDWEHEHINELESILLVTTQSLANLEKMLSDTVDKELRTTNATVKYHDIPYTSTVVSPMVTVLDIETILVYVSAIPKENISVSIELISLYKQIRQSNIDEDEKIERLKSFSGFFKEVKIKDLVEIAS